MDRRILVAEMSTSLLALGLFFTISCGSQMNTSAEDELGAKQMPVYSDAYWKMPRYLTADNYCVELSRDGGLADGGVQESDPISGSLDWPGKLARATIAAVATRPAYS